MDEDVIEIADQHYILATSSRADDRTRVLKHGDTFAIFDRYGDAQTVGLGEQGVYHEGTRYLSQVQLRLGKQRPLLLSSTVKQTNDALLVDLTNPDLKDDASALLPRGSVHLFRTKFLWRGACYERVRLTNYGLARARIPISLRFSADYKDVFEVRGAKRPKRGATLPPISDNQTIVLRYRGLDGITRHTRLVCSVMPDQVIEHEVRYALVLEPSQAVTLTFTFLFETDTQTRAWVAYDDAVAAYEAELAAEKRDRCRLVSGNEQFNAWITRSAADLAMMSTSGDGGRYPYAGVPWFSTPFGRDGIITALQTLWLQPALARSVLEFLALHQATVSDPKNDADPGKILHELRHGEMAALGEIPFAHYYGSVDSTPLFVLLAGAYYERTGDRAFAKQLWPHVLRALHWIDHHGDRDQDGFVEYARMTPDGLQQQGWKDSHDSVFHRDGSLAEGPIALCEVQGYVYAAKLGAAIIASALRLNEEAALLREQATDLQARFERAFWCEELSTYALALDGQKRQCRVRSSNPGHCLFTGIVSQERAGRVAETLMSEHSFTGWGVRTIAEGEPRYNPMSYHNGSIWPHDSAIVAAGLARYGYAGPAFEIFEGLFDASVSFDLQRLPELFCGFRRRNDEGPTLYPVACAPQAWAAGAVFMLLQSCLGVSVRGVAQEIVMTQATLPKALRRIVITGLDVGGVKVDLQFEWHAHDVGVTVLGRNGDVRVVVVK